MTIERADRTAAIRRVAAVVNQVCETELLLGVRPERIAKDVVAEIANHHLLVMATFQELVAIAELIAPVCVRAGVEASGIIELIKRVEQHAHTRNRDSITLAAEVAAVMRAAIADRAILKLTEAAGVSLAAAAPVVARNVH